MKTFMLLLALSTSSSFAMFGSPNPNASCQIAFGSIWGYSERNPNRPNTSVMVFPAGEMVAENLNLDRCLARARARLCARVQWTRPLLGAGVVFREQLAENRIITHAAWEYRDPAGANHERAFSGQGDLYCGEMKSRLL